MVGFLFLRIVYRSPSECWQAQVWRLDAIAFLSTAALIMKNAGPIRYLRTLFFMGLYNTACSVPYWTDNALSFFLLKSPKSDIAVITLAFPIIFMTPNHSLINMALVW